MNYFLRDVASYLYERNKGNLQNTVIVFPSRRARLFFNHFLSQLVPEPIWAPQYYSISDFIQQLSGLQLADPLTLLFRIFKIFCEKTRSTETFDSLYYYCEVILADFDDIDKYRINAEALYSNLSDLKAIEDYHEYLEDFQLEIIRNFWNILINSRSSDEKEKFLSIWDALGPIYSEFGDSLEKEGLAYEGRAYRRAVDRVLSDEEPEFFNDEVVFVGFNALNRSEELLFDKFKARGKTLFFWDHDESYLRSDLHEAGVFLKQYIRRYPHPVDFTPEAHVSATEQKIITVSVPSAVSQAKVIKKCLDITGANGNGSPLKTALVLADESLLLPVVNSIPDELEKINISLGYPVVDTPVYGFIALLTDLHRNKRKSKTKEDHYEFYHRDLFSILDHPFLSKLCNTEEIEVFRQECLRKNQVYVNPLTMNLNNEITGLLFKPVETPAQFSRYLIELIETITKKFTEQSENLLFSQWQLEVLFSVHKILVRFETLIGESGIDLTFDTALKLLRGILKNVSVPFSGEPLTGLQVMGFLETRTLDFENIIILSMNEGKFPKPGLVPSLIPFTLREAFGLPTISHHDAIFGYYFYRLLHRSRQVVLVYNTKSEGLQKGEPSRFILQLRYERPQPPLHLDMGYEIGPQNRKSISINKSGYTMEVLKKYQAIKENTILTPSALNTYLDCSLKFYFRYIAGIEEPDDIQEQIGADIFGRILHKTMSILYQPLLGEKSNTEAIEEIRKNRELLSEAVRQAFAEEYFLKSEVTENDFRGINLIIRRVIEEYVEGILEYDSRSAPFTIISTERRYVAMIKLQGAGIEIQLGGYIDRLEEKEGRICIIDYKTGKRHSDFSDVESLFERNSKKRNGAVFQTFLYSWIISKEQPERKLHPLLYFVRDIRQPDFIPEIIQSENRKKIPVRDFTDYATEFEERLNDLLGEIFNTSIPFIQTEDTDQCNRCPFNEICLRESD